LIKNSIPPNLSKDHSLGVIESYEQVYENMKKGLIRIENPCVGGSIPSGATTYNFNNLN